MPLYEYKCQSCGDVFEVIQKFSDTPLAVHDKCGGAVERLISPSALKFKGTGWYVTDYARKGKTGESESSSDSSKESSKEKKESAPKTETSSKESSKESSKKKKR